VKDADKVGWNETGRRKKEGRKGGREGGWKRR
jgi:hypothetical protein